MATLPPKRRQSAPFLKMKYVHAGAARQVAVHCSRVTCLVKPMFARNSVSLRRPISLHFNVSDGTAGVLGEAEVIVLRTGVAVESEESTLANETAVDEEVWLTTVTAADGTELSELASVVLEVTMVTASVVVDETTGCVDNFEGEEGDIALQSPNID